MLQMCHPLTWPSDLEEVEEEENEENYDEENKGNERGIIADEETPASTCWINYECSGILLGVVHFPFI